MFFGGESSCMRIADPRPTVIWQLEAVEKITADKVKGYLVPRFPKF